MDSFIKALAIAAMIAVPAVSFAQPENPAKTRAEVRNELIQIEKAGYKPSMARNTQFPENLQAAQARVAASNGQNAGHQPAQ
ncbi:DUF4148 domain-containing protein [Burkholderia sp. S-53]|uniref:DUF4148 domain-containing protein n=1 Tax=Burkholderia sp. S-53 TaxID=2906514 RepID=UPI0021D0D579|nr:DUF4148 domain-containing protein [Burkholderia sp. S-53]UXU91738.1 DUF4148 domain-containing protein [Burkholderia sp. S-53]